MAFYEIDFIQVGESKSGDAIAMRYRFDGDQGTYHHVVDGGYSEDGQKLVDHINAQYSHPDRIDHVVLTHADQDHASGLPTVLESFEIGTLWMNRPWQHVDALLPHFAHDYTRDGLIRRLKSDFQYATQVEETALRLGIEIRDIFQGQRVGAFIALSPTREHFLEMIVQSGKTPLAAGLPGLLQQAYTTARGAIAYIASEWGAENLKGDSEGTSHSNETSVVQLADFDGEKVLLTADAGVRSLEQAYDFAISLGIQLPGIHQFQVPHHGARRNVSTEILDKWLGQRLEDQIPDGQTRFNAVISAHKDDPDHPRKAVIRSMHHRGGHVTSTEDGFVYMKSKAQPYRLGTGPANGLAYPSDMEE